MQLETPERNSATDHAEHLGNHSHVCVNHPTSSESGKRAARTCVSTTTKTGHECARQNPTFFTPKELGQGGNEQYIGSHKLCRQRAFTTPMAPQGRLSHNAPSNTVQETEVCFCSSHHASSLVNMEKRCGIFRLASTDKETKYWKRDGQ